jgi:hypothetical protein
MGIPYNLVVDKDLEKVQYFQKFHFGFQSQKELNDIFNSMLKKRSIKENFDNFLVDCRVEAKQLMVVQLNNFKSNIFESDRVQKDYTDMRKHMSEMDFRKIPVCSLLPFVDIALRKIVIKQYFLDNISPIMNRNAVEKANSRGGFGVNTSFGFISGYKKRILCEFEDSENVSWARMIHCPETVKTMTENFSKSKTSRIFYGHPEDNNNGTRYIDFFTNESTDANLLKVMLSHDNNLAFVADLRPLIDRLNDYGLLSAV